MFDEGECPFCTGRGWVPAEPDLALWMAAAAKCGVLLRLTTARFRSGLHGDAYADDGDTTYASQSYDPTDSASILLAAAKALLEVLGQEEANG